MIFFKALACSLGIVLLSIAFWFAIALAATTGSDLVVGITLLVIGILLLMPAMYFTLKE